MRKALIFPILIFLLAGCANDFQKEMKGLRSKDPGERYVACLRLARFAHSDREKAEAIRAYVKLLDDASYDTRRVAAKNLKKMGWEPATEQEKISYAIAQQQWNQVRAFGAAAVKPLVRLCLEEPLPEAKYSTMVEQRNALVREALWTLYSVAGPKDREYLPVLIQAYEKEPSEALLAVLNRIDDLQRTLDAGVKLYPPEVLETKDDAAAKIILKLMSLKQAYDPYLVSKILKAVESTHDEMLLYNVLAYVNRYASRYGWTLQEDRVTEAVLKKLSTPGMLIAGFRMAEKINDVDRQTLLAFAKAADTDTLKSFKTTARSSLVLKYVNMILEHRARQNRKAFASVYKADLFSPWAIYTAQTPDVQSGERWDDGKKLAWVQSHPEADPLVLYKLLADRKDIQGVKAPDKVYYNLLYHMNKIMNAENFPKEKMAREQLRRIDMIKDEKLRSRAYAFPGMCAVPEMLRRIKKIRDRDVLRYMAASYAVRGRAALEALHKTKDLAYVAKHAQYQLVRKVATQRLRTRLYPPEVVKQVWKLKIPILLFFLFLGGALVGGNPIMLVVPLGQLNYLMLRWRFVDDNAWPGLIGYLAIPILGMIAAIFIYAGLIYLWQKVMEAGKKEDTRGNGLFRAGALGLAAIGFLCVFLIEKTLFSDGLNINGPGLPTSGVIMMSDVATQDESLWGYWLYFWNSVQMVMFVGAVLFVFAAMVPDKGKKIIAVLEKQFNK